MRPDEGTCRGDRPPALEEAARPDVAELLIALEEEQALALWLCDKQEPNRAQQKDRCQPRCRFVTAMMRAAIAAWA